MPFPERVRVPGIEIVEAYIKRLNDLEQLAFLIRA